MKRDFDLVREILIAIEELPAGADTRAEDVGAFGHETPVVQYHAKLMIEAGLVEGLVRPLAGTSHINVSVRALTWNGHEYLDSIRQDSVWEKTKSIIVSKGGSLTFAIIQQVATSIIAGRVH